jgi:hypothetical protein
MFSGVVMGVTRIAASAASKWRDLELAGDVGANHVTNNDHAFGVSKTSVVGRVKVAIVPRWSVSF